VLWPHTHGEKEVVLYYKPDAPPKAVDVPVPKADVW